MVVKVRMKLRAACRTLGSGATALHAGSAVLPLNSFLGKQLWQQDPSPLSLISMVSVALSSGQRKQGTEQ